MAITIGIEEMAAGSTVRTLLRRGITIAVLLLSFLLVANAQAASVPLSLKRVAQPKDELTSIVSDPGRPNRLFVTERNGKIDLIDNGRQSLFVDLSDLVSDPNPPTGEEALDSIALAPDFDQTGHFYVGYPSATDGPENIHIDELTAVGDTAKLATRRTVLIIPHPNSFHHFVGELKFGPDGYLYISTGDGYESAVAQDLSRLRGKVLRIDPRENGADPYTIPGDNPFVGTAGRDEIWSYGFRNPYRMSFDRATGDMVIGDVGEDTTEEIDYAPSVAPGVVGGKGANYGWPCFEGLDPSPKPHPSSCLPPFITTDPILTYPHPGSEPPGCAGVVGGYVVRDSSLGDLNGRYLYGDFCSGEIRSLRLASPLTTDRREGGLGPVPDFGLYSFGEDSAGRIYVLSIDGGGTVYRIENPNTCGLGKAAATIVGTAGKDNLEGTGSRDVIIGLGGDDRIRSFEGNDVVCGGAGKDAVVGGDDEDTVLGGAGNDTLHGGDGRDSLSGEAGTDRLFGGFGRDKLYGGAGRDKLNGGAGKDLQHP